MHTRAGRIIVLLVAFAVLLALGSSRIFYRLTIPYHAPFIVQIAIRKLDSLIAFAAAGAVVQWLFPARRQPLLRGAVLVGVLSLGIEIVQYYHVYPQPMSEHLFDVCCGALGGIIGAGIVVRSRAR